MKKRVWSMLLALIAMAVMLSIGVSAADATVAKIGETGYATLAEALVAAEDGGTIELVWKEGDAPIAMNGAVSGKTVTITGTAQVNWEKGFLFVGRTSSGRAADAKLIFNNANLTAVPAGGDHGIHVSGAEKDSVTKANGTVEIINSNIQLTYLINKGDMTLDNSTLTVKSGFSVGGRPASETESGEDATATMTLINSSKLVVDNHNGMGLGYEAIGVMNVKSGSTFECIQAFLVTAKGTMNVNDGTVKIADGKTLTNNGTIYVTGTSDIAAAVTGSGWVYMNGVTLDANTVLTGAKVGFINGTNTIVGSTINDGWFSVGIGHNNAATATAEFAAANGITLGDVTVNVSGDAIIGSSSDAAYTGWIGSAYSADKTVNKYELNVENSLTTFGYLHISKDGALNVKGHATNKYTYDGANVDFYAGNFIVNGKATFDGTDAWVRWISLSADHADGVVKVMNGTKLEASRHIGANTGYALKFFKAGEFNVDATSAVEIDNEIHMIEGAMLNLAGEVTVKGDVTGAGAITLTAVDATMTAADGLTVGTSVDGYAVVYEGGAYKLAQIVAKIGETPFMSLKAAIDAANNGDTITLLADVTADSTVNINKSITLDGGNHKISGTASPLLKLSSTANITVKNAALTATNNVVRWNYVNEGYTHTYQNCQISGGVYGIHYDGNGGKVIIDGCTIDGFNAFAGALAQVTVKDTTFDADQSGYAGANFWGKAVIENVTLVDEGKATWLDVKTVAEVTGGKVVKDGTEISLESYLDAAAKIGDVYYSTLNAALAAAENGDSVIVLKAGTYTLSTSGKDITITGAVDGVVFDNIGEKNMGAADVTFNNVTFDYYPNVNYTGLQHSGNLTYNNCTVNGQPFLYGISETFIGCTFNQNSADAYNVWTYGAKEVNFNQCTFNCAGKSVLVYNEGACATDLTVTDCDFIASAPVDGKAAIEIDTTLMPDGTDIVIDSATTVTGFAQGSISKSSLWNDKKNQTDLSVTVAGKRVWPLYSVTFDIPEGATIERVSGNVEPVDGVYYLPDGTYTVTVTKSGYYDATKTFTVNGGAQTVVVELTAIPATYRITVAETENGTVTLSRTRAPRNSLITITATPDAGYKVAEVEVTNFRGEEVDVTDAGDGTYTFRMPGSTTNVSVTFECDGTTVACPTDHLTDVDHSQWYHIAVDYVVSNGLMVGTGEDKFSPEATMERAMVIQVLYNMEGTPAVTYTGKFSDVSDGKWYTNAIEWGVANGILVDYGTQFDPTGAISREEMVRMMYNYAQYKGKDTSARGDLSKYTDGATTSSWVVEYVKWAVGSGVMVGGTTILNPTGSANRAEVAQIFKNFHEIYG